MYDCMIMYDIYDYVLKVNFTGIYQISACFKIQDSRTFYLSRTHHVIANRSHIYVHVYLMFSVLRHQNQSQY